MADHGDAPQAIAESGLSSWIEQSSWYQEGARLRAPARIGSLLLAAIDRATLGTGTDPTTLRAAVRRFGIPLLSTDPLKSRTASEALPKIRVFIPMHIKDSWIGQIAVATARTGSRNPVTEVVVCLPDRTQPPSWLRHYDVTVLHDSDVLNRTPGIRTVVTSGFIRQQMVKLVFALGHETPTLIQDADTFFLHPRTWIMRPGVQVLPVRQKCTPMFMRHAANFFNDSRALRFSSTVTHFQLWQPDILTGIFESPDGDPLSRLHDWAMVGTSSAPSEYQTYGTFLRLERRQRFVPSSWSHAQQKFRVPQALHSQPLSRQEIEDILLVLRSRLPTTHGVSLHNRSDR